MKIKDAIEILRPINGIMGAFTVVIGILNTRTVEMVEIPIEILLINIILGVLAYFLIAGSGMVINDIYDLEIDKINRPGRPIPRGSVSLKVAKIYFFVILTIGVAISIIHSVIFDLGFPNIFIAVLFGFLGWVYAKWGKKQGFLGNIVVSISFSIGLIYGAILNNYYLNNVFIPPYIYYFFLTSFFLLLAREIIKGCEDIEGDKQYGIKTLAVQIGINKATKISVVCDILAIIFFILPVFTQIINPLLFLISMIFGLIIVIYALIQSLQSDIQKDNFKKISLFLKIGAFLGLISFIFASI